MKKYIKPQLNIENTVLFSENIAQHAGMTSWLNEHGLSSAVSIEITTYASAS